MTLGQRADNDPAGRIKVVYEIKAAEGKSRVRNDPKAVGARACAVTRHGSFRAKTVVSCV